jgi:hypothetical protein
VECDEESVTHVVSPRRDETGSALAFAGDYKGTVRHARPPSYHRTPSKRRIRAKHIHIRIPRHGKKNMKAARHYALVTNAIRLTPKRWR